jgi:hypothetical protein
VDRLMALCFSASSAVYAWEFMIVRNKQQLLAPFAICSHLQLVSSVFCHGVVYFCMTPTGNTDLLESRQKFQCKFCDEKVLSTQTIHNLVNKLRIMELLIDKKQKHER